VVREEMKRDISHSNDQYVLLARYTLENMHALAQQIAAYALNDLLKLVWLSC
jgi:hypothetical protein